MTMMTINQHFTPKQAMKSYAETPRFARLACLLAIAAFVLSGHHSRAQSNQGASRVTAEETTPAPNAAVLQRFLAKEPQDPTGSRELLEEYQKELGNLYEIFSRMVRDGELDQLLALLRDLPENIRGRIAAGYVAGAIHHNRLAIRDPGMQMALVAGISDFYQRAPEVPIPLVSFPRRRVPHIMDAQPHSIKLLVGELSLLFDPDHEAPGGVAIKIVSPGEKTYRQWLGDYIQTAIVQHPELLEQYPGAVDWAKGLLNPDLTPEDLLEEFGGYARP